MNLRERKAVWQRYESLQRDVQKGYLNGLSDDQRKANFDAMVQHVRETRPDYLKVFYETHDEALADSHLGPLIRCRRKWRELDARLKRQLDE